jgi:fucose permease
MLEWAQPIAAKQVRLELSRLGEDAGLLGAAAGMVILLTARSQLIAGVGIAVGGLSFASIYPITLGFAGSRFEAYSGSVFGILFAIALVGGMTLPWAVGQIAQVHGLRAALVIVIGDCVMILLLQLVISVINDTGKNAYST